MQPSQPGLTYFIRSRR